MDFIAFGTIFVCFFLNSLALKLADVVAFCGQNFGRNRQGSLNILAGAAKILRNSLHICEREECSGVRRSSRKRTTIVVVVVVVVVVVAVVVVVVVVVIVVVAVVAVVAVAVALAVVKEVVVVVVV